MKGKRDGRMDKEEGMEWRADGWTEGGKKWMEGCRQEGERGRGMDRGVKNITSLT